MHLVRGVLVLMLVLAGTRTARSACGTDPGDAAAVAAARVEVESACPCAAAPDHRAHVRCAAGVADAQVGLGNLPARCRFDVRRCAARSTCGRPGAVTCCRTMPGGATRCRIAGSPSRCTSPPGGSACVGSAASCCDACGAGGCVTTTTTTTLPPPCGNFPVCNGTCPPGLLCGIADDIGGLCGCFPDGSQPCGDASFPFCNGTCPAGGHCGTLAPIPDGACACVPDGATACGSSSFPTCGGVCPAPGQACVAFRVSSFTFCACAETSVPCGCSALGFCPPGEVCDAFGSTCSCGPP
jgi:hypothetical protein